MTIEFCGTISPHPPPFPSPARGEETRLGHRRYTSAVISFFRQKPK